MALTDDIRRYWNQRVEGYSMRNRDELEGDWGLRLASLLREEADVRPGCRALDVGCGPGILSITLASLGADVTGIDLSPGMLREAEGNAAAHQLAVDFREGDAANPGFPDGTFDVIVNRWLVWNLPSPAEAYRRWLRLLKPGGRLFVMDGNHYLSHFDARFAVLAAQSAPPEGHDEKYMRNVDPSLMTKIALELPLSCVERPGWDIGVLESLGADVRVVMEKAHRLEIEGRSERIVSEFALLAVRQSDRT